MSANHGLSEKTVATLHEVFAGFPDVEQAILFGSRAREIHKPGSDIDLALVGAGLTQKTVNRIDEALDDLPVPYRFSLALLSKITDAEVLAHIERVGALFYERDRMVVGRAEITLPLVNVNV